MKKRTLAILLCLALAAGMLAGCGSTAAPAADSPAASTADSSAAKEYGVLKVGMMPFGVCVPAQYAYEQGYFSELGLNVEFYQFANGAGKNEALAAQEVDIGVSGLAMIFSLASGTCKMLADATTSSAMGVYVRPDSPILENSQEINGGTVYGSADTIKGITVLGQTGTSSQYNLDGWLGIFGLTEEDIDFVNIGLGTDMTAFVSGEGDAIAASRPYTFQLEEQGYVLAGNFEETTDTTLMDVIVARNEVVENRREELVLFMKAYEKALEEIAADDELRFNESMTYFKENGRDYSENDMRGEMNANKYVTKEYMQADGYKFGNAMIKIGQFYSDCGQIEEANLPNIAASLDPSILQEALGISFDVAG